MDTRSPYHITSRSFLTNNITATGIGASYELSSGVLFVHDAQPAETKNALYYGDNLDILRNEIKDESVDLVYLDPPFNSNATYNVLFKSPKGEQSPAQIEAFEDTWHWNEHAERAFDEVMHSGNTEVAELLRAMQQFLKANDMMAYLTMMAVRCIELRRVLKSTGSFYLHCDPTASHYLKVLLDAIFGKHFKREIIWSLETVSGFKSQANNWVRGHDTILFYTKSDDYYFKKEYLPHKEEYIKRFKKTDERGRRYRDDRSGGRIQYLDDTQGRMISDVWSDIMSFQQASTSKEFLGYPTQKPQALLERIINASSQEGDLVLDPFCGCGTAIHAAQKLKRRWIGIDITHIAISLIERRLHTAFPGIQFDVHGVPKDLEGARELAKQDKHQFQLWAISMLEGAAPYRGGVKGADSGIDGFIYFKPDGKTTQKAIVSVKGGENVSVPMIRDLGHVVDREQAKIGVFITLAEPTAPMKKEAVTAGFYETPFHGKVPKIQILTIEELFAGKTPNIPFRDETPFRKAAREVDQTEQPKLL